MFKVNNNDLALVFLLLTSLIINSTHRSDVSIIDF